MTAILFNGALFSEPLSSCLAGAECSDCSAVGNDLEEPNGNIPVEEAELLQHEDARPLDLAHLSAQVPRAVPGESLLSGEEDDG